MVGPQTHRRWAQPLVLQLLVWHPRAALAYLAVCPWAAHSTSLCHREVMMVFTSQSTASPQKVLECLMGRKRCIVSRNAVGGWRRGVWGEARCGPALGVLAVSGADAWLLSTPAGSRGAGERTRSRELGAWPGGWRGTKLAPRRSVASRKAWVGVQEAGGHRERSLLGQQALEGLTLHREWP